MRTISGKPLAFCGNHTRASACGTKVITLSACELTTTDCNASHFLLCADHCRILPLKKYLKVTNAAAEPTTEAVAEIKKPFMPYAKPHKVTSVVCPMRGGNDTKTVTR